MDDRLRHLMGTLRHLASYHNVNRLPVAERHIDEYVHSQEGGARQSALKRLSDVIGIEPSEYPIESQFWQSMEEYIVTLEP